jgi:hypothetical protein
VLKKTESRPQNTRGVYIHIAKQVAAFIKINKTIKGAGGPNLWELHIGA